MAYKRILVVDDMRELRIAIKNFLKNAGYHNVFLAESGEVALDIIEYHGINSFSLIITDLYMPNMDGLELLKKIKNLYKDNDVKTMMMSSTKDMGLIHQAAMLGINDFLLKPFDSDEIKLRVANILGFTDQTN